MAKVTNTKDLPPEPTFEQIGIKATRDQFRQDRNGVANMLRRINILGRSNTVKALSFNDVDGEALVKAVETLEADLTKLFPPPPPPAQRPE